MKSFFVILLVESFALSLGGACLLEFKDLKDEQKNIHAILCKTATDLAAKIYHEKRNYFLPALSFVFEGERRSYILTQNLYKGKGKCFISNDAMSSNPSYVHEQLCSPTSFFNFPIYCNTKLISLNNYLNRLEDKGKEKRYRLTDSEMIFIESINCLKSGLNKWIEGLVNALKGKKNLKEIELHGFTTRDMCPCCFQHVSDFLKQANEKQGENTHFFGALIQRLKAEKIMGEVGAIPVTFYISSLVKLGREEFNCSRYANYGNKCSEEEKIKISPNKNTQDLHCIFLRNPGSKELFTIKDGQENKNAISNANSLTPEYLDEIFNTSLDGKSAAELNFPITEI